MSCDNSFEKQLQAILCGGCVFHVRAGWRKRGSRDEGMTHSFENSFYGLSLQADFHGEAVFHGWVRGSGEGFCQGWV